jgi:hypothetical protein
MYTIAEFTPSYACQVLISIYTTSSAFRGILDISYFKPEASAINNTPTKHQTLASSSYFL